MPLVYEELRALAHPQLYDERRDHTLQTTALVNEALTREWRMARAWLRRELAG